MQVNRGQISGVAPGIETVTALLPQDWEFKLLDENVEPLTNADFEWADIVCTGGMLPQQFCQHATAG